MLCIRLTLQLPSDARECTNKPSGFQAFIPKLGPDLDLLMGEMSRNRGMGGILLLALFYPLLHDLLLLDLLGLPRGVGLEESPASPRIYHCPTVCRDWYTNEIEQAAAHRRPASTGCASAAYPSACPSPASREGPSGPCRRSVPQGHRHALRRRRARTGLRSIYSIARQKCVSSRVHEKNRSCHKCPLRPPSRLTYWA